MPVIAVSKVPVTNHRVLHIVLDDGTTLDISPAHPTADGRLLSELEPGQTIDGRQVVTVELVPYRHTHTYDILPGSPSGAYYANGVLMGSTLQRQSVAGSYP